MLRYEQMLIFEVSRGCNLAKAHDGQCPISDPQRWARLDTSRPITDDLICECTRIAYQEMGFVGHVAWHFYNEPLLEADRMWGLMDRIKQENPQAKFYLFSNGLLLPKDLDQARRFDAIWISNYDSADMTWLTEGHPQCIMHDGATLDNRLCQPARISGHRCLRPYTEFILDYYGNAHLCCMDWRGDCGLPNVWQAGFRETFAAFVAMRDLVGTEPLPDTAPKLCKECFWRGEPCPILLDIQHAALEHVDGPDWWRKRPDMGVRLVLEHPFMGRCKRLLEIGHFTGKHGTLAKAMFEIGWRAVMLGTWEPNSPGKNWCQLVRKATVVEREPTPEAVAEVMSVHGGPLDWSLIIVAAREKSLDLLATLPLAGMSDTEILCVEHRNKIDDCLRLAVPHGFRPIFLNKQFLIFQRYPGRPSCR